MEIINIRHRPHLQELADHIRKAKRVIILRDEKGEDIATITPAPAKRARKPKFQAVTEDDPIFDLIGIGESTIPGGISDKKHEYLLEAYRKHHSS